MLGPVTRTKLGPLVSWFPITVSLGINTSSPVTHGYLPSRSSTKGCYKIIRKLLVDNDNVITIWDFKILL